MSLMLGVRVGPAVLTDPSTLGSMSARCSVDNELRGLQLERGSWLERLVWRGHQKILVQLGYRSACLTTYPSLYPLLVPATCVSVGWMSG